MPGSVTIGHTEAVTAVEHADAERLAVLLDEMGHLMAMAGPNRLTDAQISALCGGQERNRDEFARWCRGMAAHLHEKH